MHFALAEINISVFYHLLDFFSSNPLGVHSACCEFRKHQFVGIQLHDDPVLGEPGGERITGAILHDAKPNDETAKEKTK